MLGDLILGGVIILVAAIWRLINVKRKAPREKHSIVEYVDAFLFSDQKSTPED